MQIASNCDPIGRRLAGRRWLEVLALLVSVVPLSHRSASAQYHVFWGDVHGHTSHSDGKGSLDDYFTLDHWLGKAR